MRISTTLLLTASATIALVGCVGKSEDVTNVSNFGKTKDDNASVTFSGNSTDLNSLPFYFNGNATLVGSDVTAIDTNYSKIAGLNKGISNFSSFNIALQGSTETVKGVSFYVLQIRASGTYNAVDIATSTSNSLAENPVYRIGVAKDINGTVYVFNATQVEAGLPAVLNPIGSNKLEIYSWPTDKDRTGTAPLTKLRYTGGDGTIITGVNNDLPYLDYSVNVPTTAGSDYAPYTGTSGASKLVIGNTNTEYQLVRNEFDVDTASSGGALKLTKRYGAADSVDSSKHIVFPWRPTTKIADADVTKLGTVSVSGTTFTYNTVGANVTRDIKFGNSFPGAYWKAGIGFVEAFGQIRDDRVTGISSPLVTISSSGTTITYATETVAKADGTPLVGTIKTDTTGNVATWSPKIWTTYLELTPNLRQDLVSGYYNSNLTHLPYGSN